MRKEDREYISQGTINATAPCYGIRSVNCTVSYPEAIQARREALEKVEAQIAENLEYKRVKRGKRELVHQLPVEQDDSKLERPTTTTTRTEH